MRVWIARAEEYRCLVEIADMGYVTVERTNQAAGEGDKCGVARRMRGHEFGCQTGTLRKSADGNFVRRKAGIDAKLDQRFNFGQRGSQPGLIVFNGSQEGIGIPGVRFGLRRDAGQARLRQLRPQAKNVVCGSAASMQKNEQA